MVLLIIVGVGAAAASAVAIAARRWPAIEAPHVPVSAIAGEVERHEHLAEHLRHHPDPRTETGVALSVATAVAAGGMVGVGVVLAMVRTKFGLESLDYRFARFGADHAQSWSTSAMRALSNFGGTGGVIALAVAATLVEHVRRPSRALWFFMTLVVGGQFALSNGIKVLVERARPDIRPLTGFAGTSFPSGHSTAAAATLAAVALIVSRGRSRRIKTIVAAAAVGLAVVVAGTRVFLGVHWFTDVTAGLLLGWAWFALCSIAFGGRLLHFGHSIATAERIAGVVTSGSESDAVSDIGSAG